MLAKILQGAGGAGLVYSDITVVSSGSSLGSASVTLSPAPQQNDVIFLCLGISGTRSYTIPTGYIKISNDIISASPYQARWYYKVMGATPDTTINLSGVADDQGFTYYVMRGVQTESPVIEQNFVQSATSSVGLTPPAVSVFPKCLVLVSGFTGNGASAVLTAAPSGYSDFRVIDAGGGSDTYVGSAYKTITSGSTETPGAFTLSNTAEGYLSSSIVVRPFSPSFSWQGPEFVASASTQTGSGSSKITINKPTGTIEGDLMVSVVMTSGSTVTWTGDTGWTEVADQGTGWPNIRIAYKVAGASEGASYTFTPSAGSTLAGSILTYRYAAYDAIGSFVTAANPLTLASISPTLSQSTLIAIGGRGSRNITLGTPTSMTARVTDNDSSSPSYIVCDQRVAKGPTGTRSMSTGSTSDVAGIMLAIKPTRSL